MSNSANDFSISFPTDSSNKSLLRYDQLDVSISNNISQYSDIKNQNIILPSQINSPDTFSSVSSPMVSLNNLSASYGNKVLQVDPKIASDKFREINVNVATGLLSPSYAQSPGRSGPPLGSVLQTPPDLTPTRFSTVSNERYTPRAHINDLSQGSLGAARSTSISKSINDFLSVLPPIQSTTSQSSSQSQSPSISTTPTLTPTQSKYTSPPASTFVEISPKSSEEKIQDAKKRANFIVKIGILREAYPQMKIPEPGENESIEEIEAGYKEYVKKIHVDSSVEQNKVYLLILWLLIDVVGTRFFRLPFNGRYAQSQFKYMQKYQMLLIELGERSYVEGAAEGWPVEFRLLAMAVFHGVIFALVQMLASKLGGGNPNNDVMADKFRDVIDDFLTQNKGADVLRRAEQATAENPEPPSATQNATAPLGDIGNMLGNFMPMLMGMFSGGGDGGIAQPPAPEPQIRRPTTFANRRRSQVNNDQNV